MTTSSLVPRTPVGTPLKNAYRSFVVTDADRAVADALRPVAILAALRGETLTYSEAAVAIDNIRGYRNLNRGLDVLSNDCFLRNEPSLAAVVVGKDTGRCGDGFDGDEDTERTSLVAHWRAVRPTA